MHGLASGKTGPLFVSIEITPECFVQHARDIGVVITLEQARDEMQSYRIQRRFDELKSEIVHSRVKAIMSRVNLGAGCARVEAVL